jgi:hypothetical protein
MAMMDELTTNGYTVIPNVLTSDECDSVWSNMWNWLEALPNGIKRYQPGTWGSDQWPISSHGVIKNYGIGQADWVWEVRLNERVKSVFKTLYGTDNLLTSFDGACIMRPPELVKCSTDNNSSWFHTDQGPVTSLRDGEDLREERKMVQGFVSITDAAEDDGCLKVMHGSHLLHSEFWDTKPRSEWVKKDWYKLTDIEQDWFASRNCRVVRVAAPRGSIVLWDSRLMHCNAYPRKNRENPGRWRVVVYTCMEPAARASSAKIEARKRAFESGRTTSHWPSRCLVNSIHPHTYGKPLFFPDNRPMLFPPLVNLNIQDVSDRKRELIVGKHYNKKLKLT